MPSNKQAQPLKPLLKTWTGWERGIGYLPESDEEETKGLYYANGIIGIHGELRPAPFFRSSTLNSHILRRIYDSNNNREASAIALQIPNAVQGTQPTVASIASKNGATSTAKLAEFSVGTFNKSEINEAQVVNHAANFTVKGAMFWSANGERTDGGTSTDVDATTLTVSGTPWTASEWIGAVVNIPTSGGFGGNATITSNTTSVLTFSGGWSSAGDPTDNTSVYTISWDATSTVGAGGMIGFADGTSANDRSISWNSEDNAGGVRTVVVETSLKSGSDSGTVDTIVALSTIDSEVSNPTPFEDWRPNVSLAANTMNILTLSSNSAINNDAPSSFALPGTAVATLIETIKLSTTARLSVYRSVPSVPETGNATILWKVNQTDATLSVTQFSNIKLSGINGAGAILQSNTASTILKLPKVGLNPLGKSSNAIFGAILTNSVDNITKGTGFSELSEIGIDQGTTARTQTEWRIGAETPSSPEVDWEVEFFGITSKMIAFEMPSSSTGKQAFLTDEFTPSDNKLILLTVDTFKNEGGANTPITVTGNGLTWTLVQEQRYSSNFKDLSVWKALVTSGASVGQATITFANDHDEVRWAISEFSNVNLAVGGGSAVVQSGDTESTTGTSLSHTLSAGITAGNAVFGAFGASNDDGFTKGTDFTKIYEVPDNGSSMMTQIDIAGGDTVVDSTLTTSGAGATIGIEITFVAGSSSSNVARGYDNSCIHFVDEDAGATFPSALCAFTDDDNMTITWSNNGSGTPDAINYMLFGGDDVDTEVVEWTNNTTQGEQEITGVSLVPECLITIGSFLTSQTTFTGINALFGITDGTNQFIQNWNVVHGAEPSNSYRRTSTTYSLSNPSAGQTTVIQNLDPPTGTGWTWNHTQAWGAAYKWATLAIKGVTAEVGQFRRESDSDGDHIATDISITSDAFILTSVGSESNDVVDFNASWTLGAASELNEASCSAWTDENAQSSSDSYSYDIKQGSATTVTTTGEDIVWIELGFDDGAVNVIAGVANMDIGVADWIEIDSNSADLNNLSLINYVGFKTSSDPAFSTDAFNTTGNSDANTELIVAIATVHGGNGTINKVVFNTTESLTKIVAAPDTSTYALELWHIRNPSDSTATIVVSAASVLDIMVGVWLVEGASTDFGSGTFESNDVDQNDYFTASVPFNQPDVSTGLVELNNIDLILGISVDNSATVQNLAANAGSLFEAGQAILDNLSVDTVVTTNLYKGYVVTALTKKSSMVVDTNDATSPDPVFTAHQPGWGNGTPANGEAWHISGTSCGSLENISFDEYKGTMHMMGTYLDTIYHKWQAHWYMEESIGIDNQYMYISRGRPGDTSNTAPDVIDPPVIINKIDLRSGTFGNDLGFVEFTDLTFPGQLARYKGNWFFPSSGTSNPRKLTVGAGNIDNDTWPAITDAGVETVEHLANGAGTGGFQLVGMRAGQGWRETISEIISGATQDPSTEAAWASYFGAGDRNERAAGLGAVGGGDVFLNKDGLWSYYPDTGRSSLIFEDFKIWRSLFDNIPISPWRGGLLLPHPSGLLFWTPGQLPINIGFDNKTKSYSDPPTNVTNFNQGKYLGVVGVGDFIYTLYQPDITSSEINVLCGYLHSGGQKEEIVWQVIGTTYLYNPEYNSNVGVSLLGRPLSADYETPTLWFNNGNNMAYVHLDDRAGPFRSIQRLTNVGFALLPELFFPERIDMSEMIIYTQGMRPNSDSWQLSMFANNGTEIKLGSPISRNGRSVIKIDRHDIYRAMFKLTWSGLSASEAPRVIGTDISLTDVTDDRDSIVSTSSAFGDFISGDEIEIIGSEFNDGSYTLTGVQNSVTLRVPEGSFSQSEDPGLQITVQSRHRESPAIKRIELYGQPTTRGASGGG